MKKKKKKKTYKFYSSYKIDQKYHSALKTFLLFLNRMPDRISGLECEDLNTNLIPLDRDIVEVLRNITRNSIED